MASDAAEYQPPTTTTYVFLRHFDDVKDYPLSDATIWVIFITIAYLVFVLKTGPDFMKNREPYKLKNTILAYNAFQVVVSAYFVYLAYDILSITGLLPAVCPDQDPKLRAKMTYCIYVYWLGKVTELLDTIFFVLRKKYNQVSFLHVYHHASVVIFTYWLFLYAQSLSVFFSVLFNSAVHTVMYFYYGMSALGPGVAKYLGWKKHITNFQRVQFVCLFLHQVLSLVYTTCEHSLLGVVYVLYATALFLYLFTQFYQKSYTKKPATQNNVSKEN